MMNHKSIPVTRVDILRKPDDLTERTRANLERKFKEYGHHPSVDQMDGLEEAAKVIQGMADGSLKDSSFYVSCLAPGIGKTSTIIQAIRNLSKMTEYAATGVIIFLSRVEEIAKLAKDMGLPTSDFSTIVSRHYPEILALGNTDKQQARVLFTTQQMLEACCRSTDSFESIRQFLWNGKPRQVKIWDEAILPSNHFTVDEWSISGLLDPLRFAGEMALAKELSDFRKELENAKDKDVVIVPDIHRHRLALNEIVGLVETPRHKAATEYLWKLSDKPCRVRKDQNTITALDYEDFLPKDLGPMLIMDASGSQRETYRLWYEHRHGIKFLHSPQKTYEGLTVFHWNRGSGRDAKQNPANGKKLVDGVVKAITSIPEGKPILVIHKKPRGKKDLDWEKEIRERIRDRSNVSFCTWGQHTATNDYVDCEHVILADLLNYATSQYEAIGRGAKGAKVEEDFSDEDFQGTRLGEFAHNVYQAACRGAVRRSIGTQCPQGVTLHMIFSTNRGTGFPRPMLKRVFPGCTVVDWNPIPKKLTQNEQALKDLKAKAEFKEMSKTQIAKVLGIGKNNVNRLFDSLDKKEAIAQ